jgi:site-specific DNA recombinase
MVKNNEKSIKVAIYARFSTANQSEHSIEDQVRECLKYAAEQGYVVQSDHIFSDRRKSGTSANRADLDRLRAVAASKAFEKVLVLNLARLSRELLDLLYIRQEFANLGIEIISAQEGIESFDEDATVDIHLRGFINQYNIDTIRKETRRGLVGNIERGFLAGNLGYGYRTRRTGKIVIDVNGRERGEGSVPEIIEEEAAVIWRIFNDFIAAKSVTKIVKTLNEERIPSRTGKGWNESTVSKILKCETYTGKYIWGRTTNRRNGITGKTEKRKLPREKWIVREWDALRIIDEETWKKAQARWAKIKKSFHPDDDGGGSGGGGRGSGWPGHQGYNETNAKHLLSGSLKCGVCGGAINLVSGKRDGYYGCQMARRKRCSNRRLISRVRIEREFLAAFKRTFLQPEVVQEIAQSAEATIKKHYKHLPEQLNSKNRELDQVVAQIANFISFVGAGNVSEGVKVALQRAEERERILKGEIAHIKAAMAQIPRQPSNKEILARLQALEKLLRGNVAKAAELVKNLIGPVTLEPKIDENGREHLDFSSLVRALALLSFFSSDGSNFYEKWR